MRLTNVINRLAISLMTIAFGCSDPPAPSLPVGFRFDLLNADGHPTVSFNEGEPITFRFRAFNESDKTVGLNNFYASFCDQRSSFFRVYRQSEDATSPVDYGRACFPQICNQIGIISIATKDTLTIQYNWLSDNQFCQAHNAPLPKGHYQTGFDHKFKGNGGAFNQATTEASFSIQFDVK